MFRLFKRLEKKQFFLVFIVAVLVFIQVWLELKIPEYMAAVTRLVQTPGSQLSDIWTNGLYMLLFAIISMIIAILTGYLISYIASKLSFNLRKSLFEKVSRFSQTDINKFSTSSLITRSTNDITQVEMFISMGLMVILRSPLMAIWAITKIIGKGYQWTIATAVALLIMLLFILFLVIKVVPKFKIIQRLTDKLNSVSRENLSGIRVVRAFNAEDYQEEKTLKVNEELTATQKFTQKSFAIMQPLIMTLMYTLTLSIYLIGAALIQDAIFSEKIEIFGNMIVFSSYAMQVIMSFLMVAFMLIFISRGQVSAERINNVLDTESTLRDGNFDGNTDIEGEVEFRNVLFSYPGAKEPVLHNISFKANKGDTIAFIGATGSGKTTLINLILRFFDATEGQVLVDGVDVKDYKMDTLYEKLGYVSQKAVMFNLSVKDNIAFGKAKEEISHEDVIDAIEVAQAKDFIEKMDEKEDSMIERGGTNISGGQKQRISIARAVARKPEIFIFDDSFSALDFKTESNLRQKLDEYTKDATSLVVASRVGSVLNADKIVVLNEGKVECIGNHKELIKNCDFYRQIALSQLSEEEINESIK